MPHGSMSPIILSGAMPQKLSDWWSCFFVDSAQNSIMRDFAYKILWVYTSSDPLPRTAPTLAPILCSCDPALPSIFCMFTPMGYFRDRWISFCRPALMDVLPFNNIIGTISTEGLSHFKSSSVSKEYIVYQSKTLKTYGNPTCPSGQCQEEHALYKTNTSK